MAKNNVLNMLDMDSKENREKTAKTCFEQAKVHRAAITQKFIELDEYYHNQHYSKAQITQLAMEKGWDFTPPVLPDPFIQVETQIDPLRPEFQFKGRDDDLDSTQAKIRQDVVEFILYNNRFDELMPENERHLKKLGTAFWKVAFDGSVTGPGFVGDIVIGNPDPANIFPDPNAYSIDDCEYIDYAYPLSKYKAWRTFRSKAQREALSKIKTGTNKSDTEIYTRDQESQFYDETWQVVEHWYRDEDGDIACTIQVENQEVLFIKKYWKNTRSSGNKMYPIVEYYNIPNNKSFWGIGEIEVIMDLVDSGDREFLSAILHDMLSAGDQIVIEDEALKDGTTISNAPDSKIVMKANKINAVKRLGGLGSNNNSLSMIQFIHEKIQETNGNFDSSQGKEPTRVTTASGLAQLNEKAGKRMDIKKADRASGFRRLYELTDWTALEFYNTDRLIMIRGKSKTEQDRTMEFNSDNIRTFDQRKYDMLLQAANEKGETIVPGYNDDDIAEQSYYYPRIDTEIITTDGMKQSKAFQTQATTEVAQQLENLNPAKGELLKSNIELMGLPNEQEIKEAIDETVQQQMQPQHPVDQFIATLSPEDQQAFLQMPQEEQIAIMNQAMGGM
jgi:hypothetical protein